MEQLVESNGKYYCSKCDFKCKYPAHWNQHLVSNKHNDVKRKERSDKVLEPKCKFCDYQTNKTTNMKLHHLNHHSTKEERKKDFKFYCDECNYGSFIHSLYKIHLETKHSAS